MMHRKPSHFGSYVIPSATGMSGTDLASIGSSGGMIGRSTRTSLHLLQGDQGARPPRPALHVPEPAGQAGIWLAARTGEKLAPPHPPEQGPDRAQERRTDGGAPHGRRAPR